MYQCLGNQVALLLLLVVIAPASATSNNHIQFDWDDSFKLETEMKQVPLDAIVRTRRVTLDPLMQFVIISVNDTRANLTLFKNGNRVASGQQSSGLSFLLITPKMAMPLCNGTLSTCDFDISVRARPSPHHHHTQGQPIRIQMRAFLGEVLQLDQRVSGLISKMRSKRYGVQLAQGMLPVVISTRPDVNNPKVDVDMFVYSGANPFNYFFPSMYNRNHRWNYPEEVMIKGDVPYWQEGFYIIEVWASCDTQVESNSFDVTVYGQIDDQFALTMMGCIMALFLALSGIAFLIVVVQQHRRRMLRNMFLQDLTVRGHHRTRLRHTGASKEELTAIPLRHVQEMDLEPDDAKCAICLSDYTTDEVLRQIPCGHHFHQDCLAEWLQGHRVCPLCQQDVVSAKDHRSPMHGATSGVEENLEMMAQTSAYQPLAATNED